VEHAEVESRLRVANRCGAFVGLCVVVVAQSSRGLRYARESFLKLYLRFLEKALVFLHEGIGSCGRPGAERDRGIAGGILLGCAEEAIQKPRRSRGAVAKGGAAEDDEESTPFS